jgi:hypothetical protein
MLMGLVCLVCLRTEQLVTLLFSNMFIGVILSIYTSDRGSQVRSFRSFSFVLSPSPRVRCLLTDRLWLCRCAAVRSMSVLRRCAWRSEPRQSRTKEQVVLFCSDHRVELWRARVTVCVQVLCVPPTA